MKQIYIGQISDDTSVYIIQAAMISTIQCYIYAAVCVTVIDGTPNDVLKLRNSTPMFRAYEHVYNLLNKTFLPLFHQSEEVHLIQMFFYI